MSEMSECSMFVRKMQEKNVSPMPIVGLYVAAASLLCSIAMQSDSLWKLCFYGRKKPFNIRDKFFPLNSFTLALLAVATKLTGDLTSPMWSPLDNMAKITSTTFLTLSTGSFFTTLDCRSDLLTNLTALTILIITVIVDLCIQIYTGALNYSLFPEIIIAIALLFSMLITVVCSSIALPAVKKRAELRYRVLYQQIEGEPSTVEELRLKIRKYRVMAVSGSPQSMMTRLGTYPATILIRLLSICISLTELFRMLAMHKVFRKWTNFHCKKESDYKWSIPFIVVSQHVVFAPFYTGMLLSCISRLYVYTDDNKGITFGKGGLFQIEPYWTEKLEEWRQSSIPMKIKRRKVRVLVYNIKYMILSFCIWVQIVVVVCCKLTRVVLLYVMLPLEYFCCRLSKCSANVMSENRELETTDHNSYVILLDGEKKVPRYLLRSVMDGVEGLIKMGKKQQSKDLFDLLDASFCFRGVIEFDSSRVPSLLSVEPPNCWTLPVVTLTSIAIALPNIEIKNVDRLVSSVGEGFCYASQVDALMGENQRPKSIKDASDLVWVGVDVHKWLNMDLKSIKDSAMVVIQTLGDEAARTVEQFGSAESGILVGNPLYWPPNILAANSMYRITRTLLLYYENRVCQSEEVFVKLMTIIGDILRACLTNLPHVIASMCNCTTIEERLQSVDGAAILLGETEPILKSFEERQLYNNRPDDPLCINEWRLWIERQAPTILNAGLI